MLRDISRIAALAMALILPLGAARAQTPSNAAPPVVGGPPAAPTSSDEYVLGPEDTIEYAVVGTADRTRVKIYSDGAIQTAFAGRMVATGKTPRQLAGEIAAALKTAGYYASPVVDVEVVGFASRYVTVLGAVGQAGLVPMNRSYRLSEIMARVGGPRADAADFLIIRPETGGEKRYSLDKLSAGGPEEDPFVTAGDKIFIPVAEIFYISGQVKSPGSYPIRTDMTVAQALAKSGGVTDSGNDKKVKVNRAGKKVTLKGEDKIQAGDVLTVGEKLF